MDLPDVNVWLAMAVANHPHHQRAQGYWQREAAEAVAFCRTTSLGLLRLLTNQSAMAGAPLTWPEAWHEYAALRALPEIEFAGEPDGCEHLLGEWARAGAFGARLWTDAYLAAFAVSGGLRLVSFDNDFTRFEGLNLLRVQP